MRHDFDKRPKVQRIPSRSERAFCDICNVRLVSQSDKMLLCPNCGDKVFPKHAKHDIKVVPANFEKPVLKQAAHLRMDRQFQRRVINPDDKQDIIDLGYDLEYTEEIK